MLTKIFSPVAAGFVREVGDAPIKSARGLTLAGGVFALTLALGLTFLSFVIDSHSYHEWIETAFFKNSRSSTAVEADAASGSLHALLKATDVRKIGHIVDKFEKSFLAGLDERMQAILDMNLGDERQHAIDDFIARLKTNRSDTLHVMRELEALRDGNLEGAPVEFADINTSLDRLKVGTDMLAVAAAELDTGIDQVTLHVVQKQLDDALGVLATNARTTKAAGARHQLTIN